MIILAWIGAAMLLGLLAAAAAAVLESAVAGIAARRFVWLGALVAGLALPLGLSLRPAPASGSPATDTVPTMLTKARDGTPAEFALAGWALLSAAVLANLLVGYRAMRRQARRAEPVDVFGHRVYLSDFGPAVIGFLRPRAMIPRWVSGLPPQDQRLIVAHEAEHVASGDQLLVLTGLCVVVLLPWSPAAWIALHRLRRAIELDCDARVVAGSDPVRYGNVLLEARLRGPIAPVFNLALARPAIQARVESLLSPRRASMPEMLARGAGAALVLAAALLVAIPPIAVTAAEVAPVPAGTYRVTREQGADSSTPVRGVVRRATGPGNRARFNGSPRDSATPARRTTAPGTARFTPRASDTAAPF